MLQIAVHGKDHFAARVIEAGFERSGLSEIAAQANQIHAPVMFVNFRQNFEGIVAATVVDKHQLVRFANAVHYLRQLHVQRRNVFLFVEERHDD